MGFGENIGKSIRIIGVSWEIHDDIPIIRVKLMNMPIIIIIFILSYWEYDGKYSWNMI
jgi:hypothetical protein